MSEEGVEDDTVPTAPFYIWLFLSVSAGLSFYAQATITEERFVPALNVLANVFHISDDVAGATLMAAGASSPELFSSIVALFITHSALGLGTIVGSEVFNQLVICAGAVLASRNGRLVLDKAILAREVGFYALAIICFTVAMRDRRPDPDDPNGPDHVFIDFFDGSLFFGCYILYVLVCSNFDAIVDFFSSKKPEGGEALVGEGGEGYGTLQTGRSKRVDMTLPDQMFYLKETKYDPSDNFHREKSQNLLGALGGEEEEEEEEKVEELGYHVERFKNEQSSSISDNNEPQMTDTMRNFMGKVSESLSIRFGTFTMDVDRPSNLHDLHEVQENEFNESLSCFLWKRSMFYNKAKTALNAWNICWFTFSKDRVTSVPDRADAEERRVRYPKFKEIEVDVPRMVIRLITEGHPDYYLMAPSTEVFQAVVKKCESLAEFWEKEGETEADDSDVDVHAEPSLIAYPAVPSPLNVFFFYFLFPLNFIMQFTLPDVRLVKEGSALNMAFLAILSCLVWLIVASYCMVASLEHLARLMNIPDAVIGFTVSAAGTSLPNYVASQCAAKQGFGNMAVSNAFGSNTFNILVGLGVPWFFYTMIYGEYHGLTDEGIEPSIIILSTVLLSFVVLMFISDFTLLSWHAPLFFFMYACYLAYSIGVVYIG